MFASPALCHFRKTRTHCLLERTENHGTLVWIVRFRAGMKHHTFRVFCTQHHSMATCQPHNSLRNRIRFDTSLAGLFTHYAHNLSTSYSEWTLLPPPPSAATVLSITSSAAWLLRLCLGPHEGSSEREGFGCGQQINTLLFSGSATSWKCAIWKTELAIFRGAKTVLWPHGISIHDLPTKCHISAFIV